jgi:hypothetical protein
VWGQTGMILVNTPCQKAQTNTEALMSKILEISDVWKKLEETKKLSFNILAQTVLKQ